MAGLNFSRATGPWVCKNCRRCGSTSAPGFAEQTLPVRILSGRSGTGPYEIATASGYAVGAAHLGRPPFYEVHLAGAPRGSPTQPRKASLKPVGEGIAPPAGRSGTGPYEKPNPFRSRRPSEPHLSPTTTKARFQPGEETPKGCRKLSGSGDRTETSQLSHPRLCVDRQGGLIGGPRKWGS